MSGKKRLDPSERKKEIQKSAATFFVKKGFSNTTMEDVISGTTMSKGGVYHYYSSTIDILHDLMLEGNQYRLEKSKSAIEASMENKDLYYVSQIIIDKILDDNYFIPIYVAFLLESEKNEKLKALLKTLRDETNSKYVETGVLLDEKLQEKISSDFMMHFINSLIVGGDVLGARSTFVENKEVLIKMMMVYLRE